MPNLLLKKYASKEKLKQNRLRQTVANSSQITKNPCVKTAGIFHFRLLALLLLVAFKGLSQAKLIIAEPKKNFGFVQRGVVVKNEYDIRNAGNAPLIITDVEIACSCTTVDFPKQPLLPGQNARVIVSFNTQTVYGRQDRVVYLNSNDPKGPHKLRYKGTVSNK